jgi:hypothetical protein
MRAFFHDHPILTDPTDRLGVLLILLFFMTFPLRALSDTYPLSAYITNPNPTNGSMDNEQQNLRRDALVDFAKKQAISYAPNLPDTIRDPVRWALSGFHTGSSFFSFGISSSEDEEDQEDAPQSLADLMHPPLPVENQNESSWLASPAYHHRRGILPTHDAAVLGAHMKQSLFGNYMQLDLHPYYGQNWFSQKNYYGADFSIDLAEPANHSETSRPWGKFVIGYTNGDDQLMDHGRGLDMHGELRFNDHLTLNTGMRQSDTTGGSDYVLLQWKMSME